MPRYNEPEGHMFWYNMWKKSKSDLDWYTWLRHKVQELETTAANAKAVLRNTISVHDTGLRNYDPSKPVNGHLEPMEISTAGYDH